MDIASKAAAQMQEFDSCTQIPSQNHILSSSPISVPVNDRWSAPEHGVIKFNFNGAINKQLGKGSVGVFGRDRYGQLVGVVAWSFPRISDAAKLEALAIHMNMCNLVFKGDAKTNVDAIKGQSWQDSELSLIIEDPAILAQCFLFL